MFSWVDTHQWVVPALWVGEELGVWQRVKGRQSHIIIILHTVQHLSEGWQQRLTLFLRSTLILKRDLFIISKFIFHQHVESVILVLLNFYDTVFCDDVLYLTSDATAESSNMARIEWSMQDCASISTPSTSRLLRTNCRDKDTNIMSHPCVSGLFLPPAIL